MILLVTCSSILLSSLRLLDFSLSFFLKAGGGLGHPDWSTAQQGTGTGTGTRFPHNLQWWKYYYYEEGKDERDFYLNILSTRS